MKTIIIPFTQFKRPDGRQVPVTIERDAIDVVALAETLLANGCKFEVEHLTTGHASFEVLDSEGESLAMEMCPNGPEVPETVDQLVRDAARALVETAKITKTIETKFRKDGFDYQLMEREGMIAVFSKTKPGWQMVRFEVVRLKIAPEHTWPNGVTSPEREALPSSEEWGLNGWTEVSLADCEKRIHNLAQN